MKKITTLLFLSIVFQSFAIDRFVNPNLSTGNGTTLFTNITSAITAAVNGDRIIVSSGTYNEAALTIGKSLQIMPQTPGTTINFNANITIAGFPGMKLEITGFNLGIYKLFNLNYTNDPLTTANVNIIDSSFNEVIFNQNNYILNLIGCTTNSVIFKRGYLIKNTITNNLRIEDEPLQSSSVDYIKIIANTIGNGIYFYNDNSPFIIANNIVSSGGVILKRWNPSENVVNQIHNNHINGLFVISAINVPRYNLVVTSNLWENFKVFNLPAGPIPNGVDFNSPELNFSLLILEPFSNLYPNPNVPGFFEFSYNKGLVFGTPVINSSSLLSLIMVAGNNDIINSGNPNNKFYDIDLTLNDIGINGGPYSQLNYNAANPNNSKAFIFDLDMPSDLFPGQNVEIKAKGYHKN